LSTGATKVLSSLKGKISYLIVDEACQCSELNTLQPFVLEPNHVVLVGDHKQLPATIFSDNKNKTKFDRSLFERLVDSGQSVHTLTV
jgi:superfamily I DNA and/or RNA helicase